MTAFQNLKRQTLAESVYIQLRAAILDGEIEDGAELNQVALAQQFDVSRVPIREALRRLQAERLVTSTPYQQFIVSSVKTDTLAELIDLREQIEAYAVRKHAAHITPEMIARMRLVNAALRKEEKKDLWLAKDLELHELLDGPETESARMVLDVRSRIHRYLHTVVSTKARQKQACAEHDRVISALADGDADAAEEAVREHVRRTKDIIVNFVNGSAASRTVAGGTTADGKGDLAR